MNHWVHCQIVHISASAVSASTVYTCICGTVSSTLLPLPAGYTVKPVLRDHCHERPPVLAHSCLAEGHTFQCKWTCHQRPPAWETIFLWSTRHWLYCMSPKGGRHIATISRAVRIKVAGHLVPFQARSWYKVITGISPDTPGPNISPGPSPSPGRKHRSGLLIPGYKSTEMPVANFNSQWYPG